MRIDYQKTDKTWSYLHYNNFSVGSASEEYPLTVGGYSGSISSTYALYYNNIKFTTPDNDNDEDGGNCFLYECIVDVSYTAKHSRGKVLQLQEKHFLLEKFRSLAVAKCPLVLNDNVHALILQNIATQETFVVRLKV